MMRTPKLAGLFLIVGVLLTYLMFAMRHGATARPEALSLPLQRPASSPQLVRYQYCIMFDAGSMGTRVHIIKFKMDDKGADPQTTVGVMLLCVCVFYLLGPCVIFMKSSFY